MTAEYWCCSLYELCFCQQVRSWGSWALLFPIPCHEAAITVHDRVTHMSCCHLDRLQSGCYKTETSQHYYISEQKLHILFNHASFTFNINTGITLESDFRYKTPQQSTYMYKDTYEVLVLWSKILKIWLHSVLWLRPVWLHNKYLDFFILCAHDFMVQLSSHWLQILIRTLIGWKRQQLCLRITLNRKVVICKCEESEDQLKLHKA